MGLTLAAAGMLVVAAGVAVPLVIHLASGRRPDAEPLATVRFLGDEAPRAPRPAVRVKSWPLLLVRVGLVLLLALAAARPQLAGAGELGDGRRGGAWAIVLDDGLSMRAATEGSPAFEGARAEAVAILDGLAPEARVAVLPTSRPRALLRPGPASARREVEGLAPTHRATRLGPALRAALDRLEDAPEETRVAVCLTDLQATSVEGGTVPAIRALREEGVEVVLIDAGAPPANRRILDASVRGTARPGGSAWVEVRVAGLREETVCDLRVGEEVRARTVLRPGGEGPVRASFPFDVRVSEGPWVQARVELRGRDPLPADDARVLWVPVRRPVRVVVVGPDRPDEELDWAVRALRLALDPSGDGERFEPRVDRRIPGRIRSDDVLVLCGATPSPGEVEGIREAVRRGTGLLVVPPVPESLRGTDLIPWGLGPTRSAPGGQAARPPEDRPGPLRALADGRNGDARRLRVRRYLPVPVAEDPALLLENGDPLVLLGEGDGAGRVGLLTSSPARSWSDLAVEPAFLVLADRVVAWLAGEAGRSSSRGRVGERIVLHGPEGASWRLADDAPENEPLPHLLAGTDGRAYLRASSPGGWRVVREGPGRGRRVIRPVAVSPDPRESDPSRADPASLERAGATLASGAGEALEAVPAVSGRLELAGLVTLLLLLLCGVEARRARR